MRQAAGSMLALILLAVGALAAEIDIVVDAARPLGPVNPLAFGQNLECADSRGMFSLPADAPEPRTFEVAYAQGYWDPDNNRPAPGVIELMKDYPFGALRYPGGCLAHNFRWKDTVGPRERRAAKNWAFGVDEYLRLCRALGCEPQFIVTDYAFDAKDIPQDAADLVEYLNMPATPEYPWAMKRAANGHPEPYGVKYFELGNESDHGNHAAKPSRRYSSKEYAAYANATAAAMKKVDPTIKVGVVSFPPLADGGDGTVLRDTARTADFAIVHSYYPKVEAMKPPQAFVAAMSGNTQFDRHLASFHKLLAKEARPMPVAFTEFNLSSPDPGPNAYRYSFLAGMQCAELLCKFIQPANNILMANYWHLLNGMYGIVVTIPGNGTPKDYRGDLIEAKAAARFFRTLKAFTGAEVLPVTLDNVPTLEAPASPGVLAAKGDRLVPGDGPFTEQALSAFDLSKLEAAGLAASGSAVDRVLTVRLKNHAAAGYPVFAFVDRPAGIPDGEAWQAEATFEARFVPDPDGTGVAKLGFGLQDARGWQATRCASAVYGVNTEREWTKHTGRLTLLDDSKRLGLLVRLENFNGQVSGTLEFRNLRVGTRAAGRFPAYPAASAFATRSADGQTVYVLAFNRGLDQTLPVRLRIPGFAADAVRVETLYHENVGTVADFAPRRETGRLVDGVLPWELPPHSLTAFAFTR